MHPSSKPTALGCPTRSLICEASPLRSARAVLTPPSAFDWQRKFQSKYPELGAPIGAQISSYISVMRALCRQACGKRQLRGTVAPVRTVINIFTSALFQSSAVFLECLNFLLDLSAERWQMARPYRRSTVEPTVTRNTQPRFGTVHIASPSLTNLNVFSVSMATMPAMPTSCGDVDCSTYKRAPWKSAWGTVSAGGAGKACKAPSAPAPEPARDCESRRGPRL
jgi:hypothetical protein